MNETQSSQEPRAWRGQSQCSASLHHRVVDLELSHVLVPLSLGPQTIAVLELNWSILSTAGSRKENPAYQPDEEGSAYE